MASYEFPTSLSKFVAPQDELPEIGNTLRAMADTIVCVDDAFQKVYQRLNEHTQTGKTKPKLGRDLKALQKIYTSLVWWAKSTATQVEAYHTDFVEVILPTLADESGSSENKMSELDNFVNKSPPSFLMTAEGLNQVKAVDTGLAEINRRYRKHTDCWIAHMSKEIDKLDTKNQRINQETENTRTDWYFLYSNLSQGIGHHEPPAPLVHPKALTSTEHADYSCKIGDIATRREEVFGNIKMIRDALNAIPEQLGSSFCALWIRLRNDAENIKLRGIDKQSISDLTAVTNTYAKVNSDLGYYATKVNSLRS